MKVNLGWIGLIIILAFFLYFTWYGKNVYDVLTRPESKSEGFAMNYNANGITLTSCPTGTNQYVNDTGYTMCCDGQVDSGWCNGEDVCSLSEGTSDLPTCSQWRAAYLKDKGRVRCPASMPNYFERKSASGCTNQQLNADGSWPLNDPDPNYSKGIEGFSNPTTPPKTKCMSYDNKKDQLGKLDSCENIKHLEETLCFSRFSFITHKKEITPVNEGEFPAIVYCKHEPSPPPASGALSRFTQAVSSVFNTVYCIPVNTVDRFLKELTTNDQYINIKNTAGGWPIGFKKAFCNVAERNILKSGQTLTDKELETFNPMTGV